MECLEMHVLFQTRNTVIGKYWFYPEYAKLSKFHRIKSGMKFMLK